MNSKPFLLKVIYLVLMGVILIPLSLISRPSTLIESDGEQRGQRGGQLAQLRDTYGLSQTRVAEIDPTSETMKLLSLGLRGVAVNLLWLQATEEKRVENYTQMETTLNALIKIQPNFIKVWEFQAHNLSYNISMEFDDYESRYHWVKKGIRFLTGGIGYNRRDHRITDNLGMFTGMKIGNADEKRQFRRLFRKDTEFQEEMASFIEPDAYDTRQFGHDHWLMAWHWYDKSRRLVEEMSARPYVSDLIFYMKQPSQRRSQVAQLQKEFRSDEQVKQMWLTARQEWDNYGKRPLRNSRGMETTLNSLAETDAKIQELREQLDEFAPGTRAELVNQVRANFNFLDADRLILDKPTDQRTDEEAARARVLLGQISNANSNIDIQVFQKVEQTAPDKLPQAREILNQILFGREKLTSIDRDQGVANFAYWSIRNEAESQDQTISAHQKLFDAVELRRKSIFDDEYLMENGTKRIVRRGAISVYLDAFAEWSKVFNDYTRLREGDLADILVDKMKQFQDLLKISGSKWPLDFPMQAVIDERAANGEPDELPTTAQLEEERAAREETPAAESPPTEPPAAEPPLADKPAGENNPAVPAGSEQPSAGGAPVNPTPAEQPPTDQPNPTPTGENDGNQGGNPTGGEGGTKEPAPDGDPKPDGGDGGTAGNGSGGG